MKKVFIIFIIVVFVIAGVFIYRELTQKTVINNGLDARAKDFIKKQSKSNDSFRYADIDKKKDASNSGKVTVDNCFSFNIPFNITHSRIDGECWVTYGIPQGGNIIAYKRQGQVGGFDSVPGVSLRRIEKEKYKEETKILNGKTFLIFSNSEEQVKNAFYYESGFYFVLNLIAPSSIENDAKFLKIIESVKFL